MFLYWHLVHGWLPNYLHFQLIDCLDQWCKSWSRCLMMAMDMVSKGFGTFVEGVLQHKWNSVVWAKFHTTYKAYCQWGVHLTRIVSIGLPMNCVIWIDVWSNLLWINFLLPFLGFTYPQDFSLYLCVCFAIRTPLLFISIIFYSMFGKASSGDLTVFCSYKFCCSFVFFIFQDINMFWESHNSNKNFFFFIHIT